MPTPREAFQNTVERQGVSGARVRAADFGAAGEIMGKAAQGFGQDLTVVADNVNKMEDAKAQADAREADAARVKARLEAYYGPEGFFNKKGINAVDASRELPETIRKIDETYAEKLSPRARKMFDDVTGRRNEDELPKVYKHTFEENTKHLNVVDETAMEAAEDNAATSLEPAIIDQSLAQIATLAGDRARRSGYGDANTVVQAQQKAVGKAVLGIAKRMEIESPFEAQAMVKAKAHLMDPDDVNEILAQLAPKANKEWAATIGADNFIVYKGGETATPGEYYEGDPLAPKPEGEDAPIVKEKPLDMAAGYGVSSDYGPRTRPVKRDGSLGSANHGGLDLKYPVGTPVKAALSGRVTNHEGGGYGKYTDIHHGNGLVTRYAHLSEHKFTNGATVKQGDVVALSGDSGGVAAHLHYEVRQNDQSIDPTKLTEAKVGDYPAGGPEARPAASAGREVDVAASIDKIRNSGLSFPLQEAAIAEIKDRHAVGRQAKAESEEQLRERAAAFLNTLPDPDQFTSYDQLPLDIRTAMTANPELEQQFRVRASANEQSRLARIRSNDADARGKLSQEAEWDALILFSTNPQAFAKMDIRRDFPALTSADAMRFYKLQQDIRGGKGDGAVANVDTDALITEVNRFGGRVFNNPKTKGVHAPEARATMGRVQELAIRMAQQQITANGGKPLTDIQRRAIARLVTEPTYVRSKGFTGFVPQGAAGAVRGEGTAVVNKREVARARMAMATGIEPSEEDITAYLARN